MTPEDLRGQALLLAEHAKQKMLGTDFAMTQAFCLLGRIRQDALAFVGKW